MVPACSEPAPLERFISAEQLHLSEQFAASVAGREPLHVFAVAGITSCD